MASFLSLYLPFIVFLIIALLPYYLKRKKGKHSEAAARDDGEAEMQMKATGGRRIILIATSGVVVSLVSAALFGALYQTTYESPTLGCNSCHNTYMGARMGVPPDAFKDRNIVPNLDNDKWMVEHWFYPQVVW